jgi:3-deoxy-manno-octulosonate cytidylyltransferase (CMP-KDO synthetase)
MIVRVYERALLSPLLDEVYVATDSPEVMKAVHLYGGKVIGTSGDRASGTDRIAEAASAIGTSPDSVVVNIQGDQPLFEPSMVDEVVTPLLEDPSIPMSTLIYKIRRDEERTHPNAVKTVFDKDGFALYFSRATIPYSRLRDENPAYYKHHGIYAYRNDFLQKFSRMPVSSLEALEGLEQLRALENGYRVKIIVTDKDSIEVDTPEDLQRVREMYGKIV